MKIKQLFDHWNLTGLRVNLGFLAADWNPGDADKDAAWELHVELVTRIATQNLPPEDGDEATALASIYDLFEITREVLKRYGRHCPTFSRIAIVVLNQKIRPFTAKWHRISLAEMFEQDDSRQNFRHELKDLQQVLRRYAGLLAEIANVEDHAAIRDFVEDATHDPHPKPELSPK